MIELICKNCNKKYFVKKYRENSSLFCSRRCHSDSRKGELPWNTGMKGFLGGNKHYLYGKHRSEETKAKLRIYHKGKHTSPKTEFKKGDNMNEYNSNWKADNAGYVAKHAWVYLRLGKPSICDFCKTTIGKFEWSNISGNYLRDLNDWQRLCISCHRKYDSIRTRRVAI